MLEPLSGYFTLLGRLLGEDPKRWCGGWNFGPRDDDDVTVGEIASTVATALGAAPCSFPDQAGAVHEAHHLRLSIEKARRELDWAPRWSLPVALEHTVAWYRAHHEGIRGAELRARCHADIAAYEAAGAAGGTT